MERGSKGGFVEVFMLADENEYRMRAALVRLGFDRLGKRKGMSIED